MSEGDKPKLEIYLIASYRPFRHDTKVLIWSSTGRVLSLARRATLDKKLHKHAATNRVMSILTLNKKYRGLYEKGSPVWHMLCLGETKKYLVTKDLKSEQEIKISENICQIKNCAESEKFWILAEDGTSFKFFDKKTGEVVHTTFSTTVRMNINWMGDNMQNSVFVHKDRLYVANTQRILRSVELIEPYNKIDYFPEDTCEDICVFQGEVYGVSSTGVIRKVGSETEEQLTLQPNECVTHIRGFESNLFVVVYTKETEKIGIYQLSPAMKVLSKVETGVSRDHLRNLDFSTCYGVGIMWLSHRNSHLSIVFFNNRKMALLQSPQGEIRNGEGMHFGLAVLSATKAIVSDEKGKLFTYKLNFN